MKAQNGQIKRNGIPAASSYPDFNSAKRNSNVRVNYTSNDIRIIEEYVNENPNCLSYQGGRKSQDIKVSKNELKAFKKNTSITFACESEDFISSRTNRNNSSISRSLKVNARNNSSSNNCIETTQKSQAEKESAVDQRTISPKLKDIKLRSLYLDKNDSFTGGKFPSYIEDSSNQIRNDNTYANINTNTQYTLSTNKFNQVYDFPNSSRNNNNINSSGSRLYLNHKKSQMKLQTQRKKIEFEFKANMTPIITDKAKNISRNPDLFGERLYPYHKINMIDGLERSKSCKIFQLEPILNECKRVEDLYGDHSFVNVYRKSFNKSFVDYNFTPVLNKKSMQIASDMESSKVRLIKKKGKKETVDEKVLNRSLSKLFSDSNSLSLYGNLLNTETSMDLSIASSRSLARSKALYERALIKIENKKILYEDKKKQEEEEYKIYPYKPEFVSKPKSFSSAVKYTQKESDLSAVYTRQSDWKRSLLKRQHSSFIKQENESASMHTFKPTINKSFSSLDTEFMKRMNNHMEHSVSYVRNRRKNIDEKDSVKVNSMKSIGGNYVPKPTIPQEFKFSELNSKWRENSIKDKINNLSHMRKELNTQMFFEFDEGISNIHAGQLHNIYNQQINNLPKKKKDSTSYVKMFLDQNTTPKFTKESKVNESNQIQSLDTIKIHSVESDEESFYFLNGSKNKFNKLDVTFDNKDIVLKALGNINEKYMNFN